MNQELGFETMPFEIAPEFPGELFEEESEWGRRGSFAGGGSRYSRPGSRPSPRPGGAKRPPIPRPRPILRGPRGPRAVIREPYGIVSEPYSGEPEPSSSERVRWIQDCLNQASGLRLPVTGVMGPETRSAVRSFQKQQGLRASGIVGPDTEEALRGACGSGHSPPVPEEEGLWGVLGGEQEDRGEEEYRIRTENPRIGAGCFIDINPRGIYQDLSQRSVWDNLYDGDGVYVIQNGKQVVYIGRSKGMRGRFGGRLRVFRELDLSLTTLAGRTVQTYTVSQSNCTFERKPSNDKNDANYKPKAAQASIIDIAEIALIKLLKPSANDRTGLSRVLVADRSTLVIRLNGFTVLTVSGGQTLSAR